MASGQESMNREKAAGASSRAVAASCCLPIWFSIGVVGQSFECMPMQPRVDVSLLFDLFVAGQRMRRALAEGMSESGMRPDEYAAYSLLFVHGPITATEMAQQLGMPLSTVLDYLKSIHRAGHL